MFRAEDRDFLRNNLPQRVDCLRIEKPPFRLAKVYKGGFFI